MAAPRPLFSSLWRRKGDLAVGTGPSAVDVLAVGADDQVLTADASELSGMKWADAAGGGGGGVQTIDGNAPDEAGDVDLSGTYVRVPPVGPPESYTFTVEDEADEDSWYGSAGVHVLPTWTPTVSGSMVFMLGPDNGDSDYADENFDVYLWKGGVVNTDYPDATAGSGSFSGGFSTDVYPGSTSALDRFAVLAGQPYTIVLVDWAGGPEAVGHSIDLAGVLNSLYSFGGLVDPPPPLPDGISFAVVDGSEGAAWRPEDPGTSGEGQSTHAEGATTHAEGSYTHAEGSFTHAEGSATHAEGSGTHAEGAYSHAEGVGAHAAGTGTHAEGSSVAEGDMTHAEGGSTHAEGSYTHAEGFFTHAEGLYVHAEGRNTHAEGYFTHVEGFHAHAYRTGEHAASSGVFSDDAGAQVSSLALGVDTTDATPTAMVLGLGFGPGQPKVPLRDGTLSDIRIRVGARQSDGSTASAWVIDAVMDKASGVARLIGTATPTVAAADAGAAAWDVAVTTDGTDAVVTVTGAAATNIRWVAGVEIVEVRFA